MFHLKKKYVKITIYYFHIFIKVIFILFAVQQFKKNINVLFDSYFSTKSIKLEIYAKIQKNVCCRYVINFEKIQKAMSGNERYVKQLVICHNLSYLSVLHFSLKCSSFKFKLERTKIYERVFGLLRLASSMVMYDTRRLKNRSIL